MNKSHLENKKDKKWLQTDRFQYEIFTNNTIIYTYMKIHFPTRPKKIF